MKRKAQLILSTIVVAAVASVGSAFSMNRSVGMQPPALAAAVSHPVRGSVIKVHTEHGVITVPGNGDSWEAAEHAMFVADSIADVQIVNSEVPWRISVE
jgi:hypothetical protein